jgi:heme-degrading monooxygenase HmoA
MSRAASIVEYTVNPEHAEELHARVRQHLVPAARQVKGYQGFLLLDRGDGKRLVVLLYDSVEDVQAAQEALTPVGREHTYALMSGPALGSVGTVVIGDGVFAEPAGP